jgi:hypothetical protein
MKNNTSEYQFPIFISSTDYNLIDLRAELANFLSETGYRPILSSSDGFPDKSPDLEPWESCLPVLDRCFVMVLIIDGRYGTALNWPHYKTLPKINSPSRKKVSPTHGEYLFAHESRKRMLVFVRKEVMVQYQSYRTAIENTKTKAEAKAALKVTLPKNISFESLDFLNEVKTTKPIPWIKEFENVTTVKKEVQKKMLNELAEVFMIKNKHFETVVQVFNNAMDELTPEKQKEILEKITATKDLTKIKEKLDKKHQELEKTKEELEKVNKVKAKDSSSKNEKIKTLEKKISNLETDISIGNISPGQLLIQDDGKLRFNSSSFLADSSANLGLSNSVFNSSSGLTSTLLSTRHCDKCHNPVDNDPNVISFNSGINHCYSCNQNLCKDCWPRVTAVSFSSTCPDCNDNNGLGTLYIK